MNLNQKRREAALNKELLAVEKQEKKMEQTALKAKPAAWKTELEKHIPEKVYAGLESAFCKGFAVVFDQGRAVIEKGYNKEEIRADHSIRDFAVQVKGGRKELKQMHKGARQSDLKNLAVTTLEGVGLGALGVGMPDIVLFLGTLLKGVYETALNYGFDYESRQEQLFILKMMQTALSTGEDWRKANEEVDGMLILETVGITEEDFSRQMKETASAFAVDMLLLKFIQGLPVVGIIGGAANPVYYGKVMKYVQIKYWKRYLLGQKNGRQQPKEEKVGSPQPEETKNTAMELALERFRSAHAESYANALREIKTGRKQSHWIWYIFPQIQGLGQSNMAVYYSIRDKAEALAYWNDPVLRSHMVEICGELLKLEDSIDCIMGFPDNLKLRSSMTLFWLVTGEPIFKDVLDKFYHGELDEFTRKKVETA